MAIDELRQKLCLTRVASGGYTANQMVYRLVLMIAVILLVVSCQSTPETVADTEEEPAVVVPEPEQEPEPETEPPEVVEDPTVPIEVPENIYNQAFDEVSAVIEELNEIIGSGDFDAWQRYLTDDYKEYYSDDSVLEELSAQPRLAQENIRLRTLQDYFQHVVRPSRVGFRLESLVFYSDTLVEAITVFRGQSVILYALRKTDGEWKIDTLEEPPEAAVE